MYSAYHYAYIYVAYHIAIHLFIVLFFLLSMGLPRLVCPGHGLGNGAIAAAWAGAMCTEQPCESRGCSMDKEPFLLAPARQYRN